MTCVIRRLHGVIQENCLLPCPGWPRDLIDKNPRVLPQPKCCDKEKRGEKCSLEVKGVSRSACIRFRQLSLRKTSDYHLDMKTVNVACKISLFWSSSLSDIFCKRWGVCIVNVEFKTLNSLTLSKWCTQKTPSIRSVWKEKRRIHREREATSTIFGEEKRQNEKLIYMTCMTGLVYEM